VRTERRPLTRAVAAIAFAVASAVAPPLHAKPPALDPQIAERVLALSAERITERDVVDVLVHAPTPKLLLFAGSVPLVTMRPVAEFFIAMGYPRERIENPRDGSLWYGSFADSAALAGSVAWHYEHDGVRPMLIGHSRGGMIVVQVLHELAGEFAPRIDVRDPRSGAALARDAIIDPLTGRERPVVGLSVSYAAAIATGKLMRVLLGQWDMLAKLRAIPDSVDEFTGYFIPGDPFEGTAEPHPYRATGRALVRNVTLPSDVGHVSAPLIAALAGDPAARAWIEAYTPDAPLAPLPRAASGEVANIVHAADLWYSVKKHWCIEAQRLARAQPTEAR
jgi:hypothetical protein